MNGVVRGFLFTIFVWPLLAIAQVSGGGGNAVDVTGLTAGTDLNTLSTSTSVYADESKLPSSIPASVNGTPILRTKFADRGTSGDNTVNSVTVSGRTQVVIWHPEGTLPAWLTGNYVECDGVTMTVDATTLQAYAKSFDDETVNFGGNTTDGATTDPTYAVSLLPVHRTMPCTETAPAADPGEYQYTAATLQCDEQDTCSVAQAERGSGSDGAESVDVTDLGTGTCTGGGADYDAISDTTIDWADTVTGAGTPANITLTANNVTANCTVILGFTAASAGFTASGINQTQTITIIAAGGSPATLSLQEGGDPADITDPCADVDSSLRRYVDQDGGSDGNNGLTSGAAWATAAKVRTSWGGLPAGACIAFQRGDDWAETLNLKDLAGTANNPTLITAYGTCTADTEFAHLCSNAPQFDNIDMSGNKDFPNPDDDGAEWINLRHLKEVGGRCDLSFGTEFVLLLDMWCQGDATVSNVIRVFGASHHTVIARTVCLDAGANDCYSYHADTEANRDSHWLIESYCLGNDTMEDCLDPAASEPDNHPDPYLPKDYKFINNRLMAKSLAGVSTLTGASNKIMNAGHDGSYFWMVGNLMAGSDHICVNWPNAADKTDLEYSGNVVWGCSDVSEKVAVELRIDRVNTFHNTFIQDNNGRSAVSMGKTAHTFDYNLVWITNAGNNANLVQTNIIDAEIDSMDNNYYSPAGQRVTDNKDLAARQAATAFDTNSDDGAVTGLASPSLTTYGNPGDWEVDVDTMGLVPTAGWEGCAGANTPGAFDCTGTWLGLVLNAITGAPNNGCGWEGLPFVAFWFDDHGGFTGDCVPAIPIE